MSCETTRRSRLGRCLLLLAVVSCGADKNATPPTDAPAATTAAGSNTSPNDGSAQNGSAQNGSAQNGSAPTEGSATSSGSTTLSGPAGSTTLGPPSADTVGSESTTTAPIPEAATNPTATDNSTPSASNSGSQTEATDSLATESAVTDPGAGELTANQDAAFTIQAQLASDINPDAPTTVGIVTWSVGRRALTEAMIEFGLDASYGMTAPVDLTQPEFRTLLLGMKPERTYHFRVVVKDADGTAASADQTLDTGAATTLVKLNGFNVVDPAGHTPGFITLTRRQNSTVAFIIDPDGEVVWWYDKGYKGMGRSRMSADGKNMWMVISGLTGAAPLRVSMDTLDVQSYDGLSASHDITPVTGSTMAFLEYGESDCNSIWEIDPEGNTREVFESEGVVSSADCHANALRYSGDEDLFTFSDHQQDVLGVSRGGEVQWRLSELVSGGHDAWGGQQHGHHLLQDSMLIFANRGAGTNASAVVEYGLDGTERKRLVSAGFTGNLGDVQRLPNGHTLINYGNAGVIQELDDNDQVVLEIDGGSEGFAYGAWTSSLYDPAPDVWQQ